MCKCCGEIDFDINEVKVFVNDEGILIEVLMRECGEGECLIELFMLVVNEIVVEYFNKLEVLFIYCVYE